MSRIAFFDLDRTLLSVNSGSLWVRSELRLGYLSRWQAARAAGILFRYHLGFAALDAAVREAIATLAGSQESDLRARTLDFYRREIAHLVRPGARTALERHRAAGDLLVLLTTSSNYLSEPVGADLGLDDWLCNRFEVVDGRFTGAPLEPLVFGHGKLAVARGFAQARGVELRTCSFYTDSIADLPVLEAVAEPVVVHPDPRLRRLAKRRGWRQEEWDRPTP